MFDDKCGILIRSHFSLVSGKLFTIIIRGMRNVITCIVFAVTAAVEMTIKMTSSNIERTYLLSISDNTLNEMGKYRTHPPMPLPLIFGKVDVAG